MQLKEDSNPSRNPNLETGSDLPDFETRLQDELPAWKPEAAATAGDVGDEGRLAKQELKDALEALIDPKFRFNVAGRDIEAAVDQAPDFEKDALTFVGDLGRLMIRSLNERIDRFVLRKPVRIAWARLRRDPVTAELLRRDVPFMVREVILVRGDGTVASSVKQLTGDAPLTDLLDTGTIDKSPKMTVKAERKAANKTFAKIARVAEANRTVDRSIVFATGSRFAVVASVQGIVPKRFQQRLVMALRGIEQDLDDGKVGSGMRLGPAKARRAKRYLSELVGLSARRLVSPTPWVQAFGVTALLAFSALILSSSLTSWHETRWQELVADMDHLPGIEIASARGDTDPRVITGFRDSLADDPLPLISAHGFDPGKVAVSLLEYRSSDPAIILKRAEKILNPPATVTLQVVNRTVFAKGDATNTWIKATERQRPALLPQAQLDLSGVNDTTLLACRGAAEKLLPLRLDFDPEAKAKTTMMVRDFELAQATEFIVDLQERAADAGIDVEIRLVGRYLDGKAPFDIAQLRAGRDRADHVRDLLLARDRGIDPITLRSLGERPLTAADFDATKRNHAVEFEISLNGETLKPEEAGEKRAGIAIKQIASPVVIQAAQ